MNRTLTALSIATAFAAGCGVTHLMRPAIAAETVMPQIIHTGDLSGDTLGKANAGGMHAKNFVNTDGATISLQEGTSPENCIRPSFTPRRSASGVIAAILVMRSATC